jgi:hypothetical protein
VLQSAFPECFENYFDCTTEDFIKTAVCHRSGISRSRKAVDIILCFLRIVNNHFISFNNNFYLSNFFIMSVFMLSLLRFNRSILVSIISVLLFTISVTDSLNFLISVEKISKACFNSTFSSSISTSQCVLKQPLLINYSKYS